MSEDETFVVFHFYGEFDWNTTNPVYRGGEQIMMYLSNFTKYSTLFQGSLQAMKWVENDETIEIQYLHNNRQAFTLIKVANDGDVNAMLKVSRDNVNGLYLYVSKKTECSRGVREGRSRLTGLNEFEDIKNVLDRRTSNLKEKNVGYPRGRPISTTRDSHKSSSKALGRDIYNFEVNPDIGVKSLHSCDTIYSTVDLKEDIGAIFSFSRDHFALINSQPWATNDDPTIGIKMQEDVGILAETSAVGEDTNIEDTLVPVGDFKHELLESTMQELCKGRVFPDSDTLRRTLVKFAMYKNFVLKHLKTNDYKVTAQCDDATCPWRIHAFIVGSGPQVQVRTYNPIHSCSKPMMGMAHKPVKASSIADFVKDRLRFNNKYTLKEIMFDFEMEFGVMISYRKAYLGREIAMNEIRGSFEESFQILLRYCMELQMTNSGTRIELLRHEDNSFRPVIAVDGAHIRGKYPSVILTAATYDGNYQLFPLAFAIVGAERRDSWSWFFANLQIALGESRYLTIVSDCQKDLVLAVEEVFLNAQHCYFCRHIAENICSRFKDDGIIKKSWFAAKSYRPCEYEAHMNDIKAVNVDAYNYNHAIGRQHWSNAFVEGRRYDMLTQNIAECLNSLMKHNRELPISKQVVGIRGK